MEDIKIEQVINEITIEASGVEGKKGADGINGKSAYEIALDNGFTGSESEWLESLEGAPGSKGDDGKSAYVLALEGGFVGSEAQWLASLHGAAGNAASVSVGATTTIPAGSNASVTNTGTTQNAVLAFSIPKGADGSNGTPASVQVGTVTTLPAGSNASVTNTGTTQNAVFAFGIPKGADGASIDPAQISAIQAILDRSDATKTSFKYKRFAFSQGITNAYASLTFLGFYSSSNSKTDYTAIPVSYVNGKEHYYYPSKYSFKDNDSPLGNSSGGYRFSAAANFYHGIDFIMRSGQRTNFDSQLSMFTGLTTAFSSVPNPYYIFEAATDSECYVGFGYSETDSNIKFVFKNNNSSAPFSVPLSSFTGTFLASDIVARQKEVQFAYRFRVNDNKDGLMLYFINLATNRYGTYNLLFSTIPAINLFDIKAKFFSPVLCYKQKQNTATADNIDFFMVDLWSN